MRAVILAGGKGTRLHPYTLVLPKPLMPIGDLAILEIVLLQLATRGFTRVTLAVGYLADLIRAVVGDGRRYGLAIDFSMEREPLGHLREQKASDQRRMRAAGHRPRR